MATRRFQRSAIGHKGSTYTCRVCDKKTRETGEGEAAVEMCAYCFLEAGIENELSDGYLSQSEFDQKIAALKQKYGRS